MATARLLGTVLTGSNSESCGMTFLTLATLPALSANMSLVDIYLREQGVPSLPVLPVIYGDDVTLQGESSRFSQPPKNELLANAPRVQIPPDVQCAVILFLDLDAGARPGRRFNIYSNTGRFGPFVHSLWSHCSGGEVPQVPTVSCKRTHKAYLPPGHTHNPPNRYMWLLLRHACNAGLHLPNRYQFGKDRLSVSKLLTDNVHADLSPLAYNFLLVGGDPKQLQL